MAERGLTQRNGVWIVRWTDARGKERYRRTRGTKDDARRLLRDIQTKVERQKFQLEPIPGAADITLSELMDWYWKRHGSRLRSQTLKFTLDKHVRPSLGSRKLRDVTTDAIDEVLNKAPVSAATHNKMRSKLHRMFQLASMPGAGLFVGVNPVVAVPRRKVVRQLPNFLRFEEVPAVLEAAEGHVKAVFATALYTGMRKGEVGGLRKADVHLDSGEIWLQRCWDHETTKDGKPSVIPIAPPLRPYLEDAVKEARGPLVFPNAKGEMHSPTVGWDDALRRALVTAGLIDHYVVGCRAWRCTYRAESPSPVGGTCPKCEKPTLYSSPRSRHVTFKDLRHTTATLLLKAGVPLATVQRVLRHSDPKLTANIYGHLEVEDMRAGLERMAGRIRAPAGRGEGGQKDETPVASAFALNDGGFDVGATGFEPATTCTPKLNLADARSATGRTGSQPCVIWAPVSSPFGLRRASGAPGVTGWGAPGGRAPGPLNVRARSMSSR